jgi:plastocyanin
MKRLTVLSIFAALALLLSSCSALGKSSPATKTIKATHTPPAPVSTISINNGKFRPKNVTVKLGTTLTWVNNDDTEQSVTSDAPGVFDSGLLPTGGTFAWTFKEAGVFPYHSAGVAGSYGSVTVSP